MWLFTYLYSGVQNTPTAAITVTGQAKGRHTGQLASLRTATGAPTPYFAAGSLLFSYTMSMEKLSTKVTLLVQEVKHRLRNVFPSRLFLCCVLKWEHVFS